jgi:hypothetical protein
MDTEMSKRVIRICIRKERSLYDELYSAMEEHREYDGCYVMQYSEYPVDGEMIGQFMLRESNPTE